jgi:integrase
MTLALVHDTALPALRFDDLIEDAAKYLRASRSPATLRAYESDLHIFSEWCAVHGKQALPAEARTVAAFCAAEARRIAPGTLARRMAAIRWAHESAGQVSPTTHPQVRGVIAGIKRTHTTDPKQARPIYLDDLRAMVEGLDGMRGARDRALLTVGWWGAFRRSELAALRLSDLEEVPESLIVKLRRSKTDQDGKGRRVPLSYVHGLPDVCPVRATRAWINQANISRGRLLHSVDRWGNPGVKGLAGEAIAQIIKARAAAVGIDSDQVSGHSLRAGFVSECDRRGVPDSAVMRTTGHKTVAMLDVYSRPRALFEGAAATYFDESSASGEGA